jgi:hypothetical protein
MPNNYLLLCFVDEMLVAQIPSSVIPRIGETMYINGDENATLLFGQIWEVLHVNYSFIYYEASKDYPHLDTLNQVRLTLTEAKMNNSGVLRDFSSKKKSVV